MDLKPNTIYEFGPFRLSARDRLLSRNGEVLPLPPKVVDTLVLLVENSGHVLEKEELMRRIWPDAFVEENNLNQNISALRKALGDSAHEKFIETIPRRGYRFVAAVRALPEDGDHIIVKEQSSSRIVLEEETQSGPLVPPAPKTSTFSKLRSVYAATAVLLLAGIAFILWQPWDSPGPTQYQRLISTFPGSHRSASFSPDGSLVAFVNEVDGVPQIWVKNLVHGDPIQITEGDLPAHRPRWSPGNDQIAFARGQGWDQSIWMVPPLGGAPYRIIDRGRNPNWSRDNSHLVFEKDDEVWTCRPDGSEAQKVQGIPPVDLLLADRMPAYSPDGRQIAFFQCSKGPIGDIWVIPSQGGTARRLTFDDHLGGTPVWTPDGESIVFSSMRSGSRTIWKVPTNGQPPQPILISPGDDTEPDFSADGRMLIYTNTRNRFLLTVLDPDTMTEKVLRESRVDITDPSFSPDGTKIAFFEIVENGDIQVFTIDLEGRDLTQITRGKGERNIHPRWGFDGPTLYFYQLSPSPSFRRISIHGGPSQEVMPGWYWGTHSYAQVDPSGKRIAYNKVEGGRRMATMIHDIDGGTEIQFMSKFRDGVWSRDGRFILGTDIRRNPSSPIGDISICAVESGICRNITEGYNPKWSTDGSKIYFFRLGSLGRQLWSISNDGSEERKIADLRLHPIGTFYDVSPKGEIVFVEFRQGRHELWVSDLMR